MNTEKKPDPHANLRLVGSDSADAEKLAVDIKTAAHMLSVSPKTIRKAIKDGEIRSFRPARSVRIRVKELSAYITKLEKRAGGVTMPQRNESGKFEPGQATPLLKM